jgi:nucleoside-diphosphate-sugar epimerase
MNHNKLAMDLDYILSHTQPIWNELRDQSLFITGGTGFFGTWLLETLVWANEKLNLNMSFVVLTRDKNAFAKKAPHLINNKCIQFHLGDVRNFDFPTAKFSYVIHAATEASAKLNQENPKEMLDTILEGTRHVLKFAATIKPKKFLFVSSGAVYGKQPAEIECVDETYSGRPLLTAGSAYAFGKYIAEEECITHAKQHDYEMKIARCFAFVGPYLPLDIHFAIGNFIRDGLAKKTIHINGDGTPYRSYLYAADLIIWLLHILCRGDAGVAYNVGSDESISIAELAKLVAKCFEDSPEVVIAKAAEPGKLAERYVPSVQKVRKELGLTEKISLVNAIEKTIEWYRFMNL